jgi:hypothetical protein
MNVIFRPTLVSPRCLGGGAATITREQYAELLEAGAGLQDGERFQYGGVEFMVGSCQGHVIEMNTGRGGLRVDVDCEQIFYDHLARPSPPVTGAGWTRPQLTSSAASLRRTCCYRCYGCPRCLSAQAHDMAQRRGPLYAPAPVLPPLSSVLWHDDSSSSSRVPPPWLSASGKRDPPVVAAATTTTSDAVVIELEPHASSSSSSPPQQPQQKRRRRL